MEQTKRIHLILTGGGTRGIYQIGALKALEEAGIMDNVVSVSSCSIGAINSAFMHQYGIDECYHLWKEFTQCELFTGVDHMAPDYYMQVARQTVLNNGLDIRPFKRLLDQYIDESILRSTAREICWTSYNQTKRQLEYHSLSNIEKGTFTQHLLASSRLPVFQPVYINGDKYIDGGIGDNQPYYCNLDNRNFDMIIKVRIMYIPWYIPGIAKRNIFGKREIEISPSKWIGPAVGFRYPDFDSKYHLGYRDTVKVLEAEKLI